MKSPEEIKKELHQYIDNIEDEEILWMVHEEVANYLKKEKVEDREEDLTEEEISEIKIGLEQIKNGETVDWNEYSKATSRWRTNNSITTFLDKSYSSFRIFRKDVW